MKTKKTLAKVLATLGTILVLLPLLAPICFSFMRILRIGFAHFNFDFLMPAELFPVVFLGGALIVIASIIAHSKKALIIWSFALAAVMFIGGSIFALVTGLASGQTEPIGLMLNIVLIAFVLYDLMMIPLGIGGILLVKNLFKK